MDYKTLNVHATDTKIDLKIGSVLVISTDDGPSGPGGQSMSRTCNHTYIHHFETEEDFRNFIEKTRNGNNKITLERIFGRNGTKGKTRICKIGDNISGEQFHFYQH